ncbi:hypothetical protein F2Q69_00021693 [Brassica cretica]|uniref:Uncharacterized protein n=1 Tax=Brassica cretica TaxID=69181 RepID=A0A8S9QHL1_BRACR|nr:hypothetical protein F2Q69_00021693 [Brassica cretica]
MPVLLKSDQSASREEAVEEIKDCRSITQHWCRSTVMPERGPSIFQDRLKHRSHTKLPKYPWATRNPIYVEKLWACDGVLETAEPGALMFPEEELKGLMRGNRSGGRCPFGS